MNQPALRTSAQPPVHIQVIDHSTLRPQIQAPARDLLKDEVAHLHRVRAAVVSLERAVTEALADKVPAESIDQTTRPVLAGLRTALHAPGRPNKPVDLDEYQPDLSDGYPDNLDRAAWAAEALRTFGLRTRQIGPHNGACVDGVEEMAGDLICDLMHLLDAIGADAEHTVERGVGYHEDEVDEEGLDEDEYLRELIGA
ncbi:MAG TPA: hypothetical protein VL551_27580 [Actinospica sp.]|jgi:hypothetical protein|nr:hypothetical protein [Actinospica sp.]